MLKLPSLCLTAQAVWTQRRLQCLWTVHTSQRDGDEGAGQRLPPEGKQCCVSAQSFSHHCNTTIEKDPAAAASCSVGDTQSDTLNPRSIDLSFYKAKACFKKGSKRSAKPKTHNTIVMRFFSCLVPQIVGRLSSVRRFYW